MVFFKENEKQYYEENEFLGKLQHWVCVKCHLKQVPILGTVTKFPF